MEQVKEKIEALMAQYEAQYQKQAKAIEDWQCKYDKGCEAIEEYRKHTNRRIRLSAILFSVNLASAVVTIGFALIFKAVRTEDIKGWTNAETEQVLNMIKTSMKWSLSLTLIALIVLGVVIITVMHPKYDKEDDIREQYEMNKHPQIEWKDFYRNIENEWRYIKERAWETKVEGTEHVCIPTIKLQTDYRTGPFGTIEIASKSETHFMTSIYGKGKPEHRRSLLTTVQLDSREKIQAWEKIPRFDEMRMPYIKVKMFNGIANDWTFLVPYNGNAEEIKKAFDTVSEAVLCDILLNMLQKGLREGQVIQTDSNGKITEKKLAPYFDKEHKKRPEQTTAEWEYIENIVCKPVIGTKEMLIGMRE